MRGFQAFVCAFGLGSLGALFSTMFIATDLKPVIENGEGINHDGAVALVVFTAIGGFFAGAAVGAGIGAALGFCVEEIVDPAPNFNPPLRTRSLAQNLGCCFFRPVTVSQDIEAQVISDTSSNQVLS